MNAMTRPVTMVDTRARQRDRVGRHQPDPEEIHLPLCRACGQVWPCDVVELAVETLRAQQNAQRNLSS
jgi:hypothetical protein